MTKITKRLSAIICIVLFLTTMTLPVHAVSDPCNPNTNYTDPPPMLQCLFRADIVSNFQDKLFAFILFSSMAVGALGSGMWIFSQNDPQKIQAAQGTLIFGIIGMVAAVLLRIILLVILKEIWGPT